MKIPVDQFRKTLTPKYRVSDDKENTKEVQVPAFDIIDKEGNVLKVGDKVAAAVTVYRSADLRVAKIKHFIEIPQKVFHTDDWYDESKHAQCDALRYEIKFEDAKFTRDGAHVVKIA